MILTRNSLIINIVDIFFKDIYYTEDKDTNSYENFL